MAIAKYVTARNGIILAIVVVVLLLAYATYRRSREVLSPNNDPGLLGLFNSLNPQLGGNS